MAAISRFALPLFSLDVPVLFDQYGLGEIWDKEAYSADVGVQRISAGAWDPCHFRHQGPDPVHWPISRANGSSRSPRPAASCRQFGVVPVTLALGRHRDVAVQTGELDGIAWSGITEDYTVGWADVTNYFLTNNISGAWSGLVLCQPWTAGTSCPPHLQSPAPSLAWTDSSHYYRQWWYWGGEAHLRVPTGHQDAADLHSRRGMGPGGGRCRRVFWDEIAAESETKAKVVDIFRKYNDDMQKAGRPYRYG